MQGMWLGRENMGACVGGLYRVGGGEGVAGGGEGGTE